MMRVCQRRHAAVLAVPLLLLAFRARATPPDNVFAALDAATLVCTCQIEQVEQPAGARLVIARAHTGEVLKGSVPVPGGALAVVQELVFPSDVASVTKGTSGLCVLEPMPTHSAYRAVLTAGPYFQYAMPKTPVMASSLVELARQWLALEKLPAGERTTQRVQLLLARVADAQVSQDALTELGSTPELGALLERIGYDHIGALLRDDHLPLDRRRALLTLLVDRHVTAAVAMLQAVHATGLTPFLHQAIVALGGSIPVAALHDDLKAGTDDERLAGIDALGTSAARSKDDRTRQDAIATLAAVAAQDGSAAVRIAAVDQLGRIGGDACAALEPLLGAPDTHVVYAAGRALGVIGSPAALQTLAQQFKQGSYDAQVAAVFALREMATPDAMRVLADVKTNPPDPR